MAYSLNRTWSLESLIDYLIMVIAALKARVVTAHLAEPWVELRGRVRLARDERDAAREHWLVTAVRVRVVDVDWDHALKQLSGQAYLDSGKDADAPPYQPLFGTIPAASATEFGPHKATAYGRGLLLKGGELAVPTLTTPLAELGRLNIELEQAGHDRDAAEEQLALLGIRRSKLVAEAEALGATTEVALLTLFPGRKDLIRSILAPPRDARRSGGGGGGGEDGGTPTE